MNSWLETMLSSFRGFNRPARRSSRRPSGWGQKKSGPSVEALEQRLLLTVDTVPFEFEAPTLYEDRLDDGRTPDDPFASDWGFKVDIESFTFLYESRGCPPVRFEDNFGQPAIAITGLRTIFQPNGSPFSGFLRFEYETCTDDHGEDHTVPLTGERAVPPQPVLDDPDDLDLWNGAQLRPDSDCVFYGGCFIWIAFRKPIVTGVVFEDHNGDGERDPEDQTIVGQQVCVADRIVTGCSSLPDFVETDAEGDYLLRFGRLIRPDEEMVIKVLDPDPGQEPFGIRPSYFITTDNAIKFNFGGERVTRDIGVFRPRTVRGEVYEDRNGNGMRDAGEVANPNFEGLIRVFADADECISLADCLAQIGVFPAADYTLNGVGTRVIHARPIDEVDYLTITEGRSGYAAMRSGVNLNGADFGIFQNAPIISGQVFEDRDGSGGLDSHEDRLLANARVELDLDDDGTADRTATTDELGGYRFLNVPPGTHRVRLVLKPGAVLVQPADPRGLLVTPQSGEPINLPFIGVRLANDIAVTKATRADGNRVEFEVTTDGRVGAFQIGLYQSADETFDAADTRVGSLIPITPAEGGGAQQGNFNLPQKFRRDPARPRLVVVADPQDNVVEFTNVNNTRVVESTADIAITSAQRVDTAGAGSPQVVTVNYAVADIVGDFDLGLYRSADPQFGPGDLPLGNPHRITPVPGVTSGEEVFNIGLYRPDPDLPYLVVGADRDNNIDEANEDNNASGIERVMVLLPMRVGGNVTYNEPQDRFEANGMTQIGLASMFPIVQVAGMVSYNANTINVSGDVDVHVLGSLLPLFTGQWTIDVKTSSTTALQHDLSAVDQVLTLAAQPIDFTGITFVNPGGLNITGRLVIGALSGNPFEVVIEAPNSLTIGPNGVLITGQLKLPNVKFRLAGVEAEAEDMSISYTNPTLNTLQIRGKLSVPNAIRGASIKADLAGDNFIEISRLGVNVKGSVTVENAKLFPGVLEIVKLTFSIDTAGEEWRAVGEIALPKLTDVTLVAGAGFKFGVLNFLTFGVENLNRPAPIPGPGWFLQRIQGQVDNLANSALPIEIGGSVGFTYGPQLNFMLTDFPGLGTFRGALLRLDGTLRLSTDLSRFTISGEAKIVHEDILSSMVKCDVKTATLVVECDGSLAILKNVYTGSGTLKVDAPNLFLAGSGMGTLKLPTIEGTLLRGQEIATGTAYIQASLGSGYIIVFGRTTLPVIGTLEGGVKVEFPSGNISFVGNVFELRRDMGGGRLGAALARANPREAATDPAGPVPVPDGVEKMILLVEWENDVGPLPVELVLPSGQVLTEADFDGVTIGVIDELSTAASRAIGVLNPQPGDWTARLLDADGAGAVQVHAFRDAAVPTVEVTAADARASDGVINYSAFDSDSDAAVQLFYDTDAAGFDGVPIGTEQLESDGSASAPWDTTEIPDGSYFIYAMIDDGNNAPVFDYLETPVTVDNTAPTVLSATLTPDAARRNLAAINVAFDEALAPAGANNIANYVVRAPGRDKRLGTGDDVTVPLRSATLDAAANSVRLVPMTAQKLNLFFQINVLAKTDLTDVAGNALAADAAPGVAFSTIVGLGTKLRFVDPDGDSVSLALTRGGLVQLTAGSTGVRLRLDGTTGASTLTGSVKQPRRGGGGNGTAVIQSITAPSTFVNRLPASIVVNDPIQPVLAAVIDELLLESGAVRA